MTESNNKLYKYTRWLRVYILVFKMALMKELEYKYNFLTWQLNQIVTIVSQIVLMGVIFGDNHVNGWSFPTTLILIATSRILPGVGAITFMGYTYEFSANVRNGYFDSVLTKPINTQFWTTFTTVDLEDIGSLIFGLILLAYAININGGVTVTSAIFYIIMLILAGIILYSVLLLVETCAFFVENMDTTSHIVWGILNAGAYPITLFKDVWFKLFMIILPLGVLIAVPTEILVGIYHWEFVFYSIFLAILLYWASHKFFFYALQHYQSGGG